MEIKKPARKNIFSRFAIPKNKIVKFIAILFVLEVMHVLVVMVLFSKVRNPAILITAETILANKADLITSTLKYYFKGLTLDVPSININIKHMDFQRLSYERKNALEGKKIKASSDYEMPGFSYVPAKIDYKGQSYNIKLRLKGDRHAHFSDESKWSFRVRLKGDSTLFGLKIFSVHKPILKNYIHEWIFHKALEREDVLSLRYKFINVSVNGKNLGVYALEEHFDKLLVESRKRKEGPILRFNEDFGGAVKLSVSPIEPYNKKVWSRPENSKVLQQAVNLLESFRQGKLKVSQVFDVKKLATFFAITDLLGTHHGAVWKSMRFYYNPITSRLEPVGFDGHHFPPAHGVYLVSELGVNPDSKWFNTLYAEWFRLFFNNPDTLDVEFMKEYVKALDRVNKASYLDELFNDLDPELDTNMAIIYKNFPLFGDHANSFGPDPFYFTKSVYYGIQKHNRSLLDSPVQRLAAYYGGVRKGELTLELGNINSLPLEIVSVKGAITGSLFPERETILSSGTVTRVASSVPEYAKTKFKLPKDFKWSEEMASELIVSYRILGQERLRTVEVHPWSHLVQGFEKDDLMMAKSNIDDFDFIKLNEADKIIFIKPGKWTLNKNMIVPKGYMVVAGSGTEVNLINRSSIVSRSPVKFTGTKEKPVKVTSSDSTGGGFMVMNADKISNLTYTTFENLSNPAWGNWSVTGAVTFYKSDVNIKNTEFKSNRSEDGLNIIRSNFNINSTIFNSILSDALDSDFSSGNIKNSTFNNIGNDAIDLSGGKVELHVININTAGDKGISLGEDSFATATGLTIKNAAIAVASKDKSLLTVSDLNIIGGQVGLTVFQKKSEFGPGRIKASRVSIKDTEIPYLVEKRSSLTVDKEDIAFSSDNVGELLYGAVYGKSSK